jgi:hypothetical protein
MITPLVSYTKGTRHFVIIEEQKMFEDIKGVITK